MSPIDYSEHFWGEKHHGYQILYENLKQEEECVQELAQFFKERASLEEECSRYLAKSICKYGILSGTGSMLMETWQATRNTLELLGKIHSTFLLVLQQLLKDISKYHEDLVRYRKRVKEQDFVDAVNLMQTTTTCLQKSKETYTQRWHEVEKLRKEGTNVRELSKAEAKLSKSRDEYRSYVVKYGKVRNEFEEKMLTCTNAFQSHDQTYLQTFKGFLVAFARAAHDAAIASSQVYGEYRQSVENINISDLMLKFVERKGTGKDRPETIDFEDMNGFHDTSAPSSSNSSTFVQCSESDIITTNAQDLLHLDSIYKASNNSCPESSSLSETGSITAPTTTNSGLMSGSTCATGQIVAAISAATVSSSSSAVPFTFSTSLGRQKLSLWLPGKRRKFSSQSNLPVADLSQNDFVHSHSEYAGFLRKYRSKVKKSTTDLTNTELDRNSNRTIPDDSQSTASSNKSDEKNFVQSNGDENFASPASKATSILPSSCINENNPVAKAQESIGALPTDVESHWSSCTDSSDEDETMISAAKLRQLNIRPLGESKSNVSVDELRDAVGNINLNSMTRSTTFDTDPWTVMPRTMPFSVSLGYRAPPLRAALTGDDHLRNKFSDSNTPLPFSVSMIGSISGCSIARARPRSSTPTPGTSYFNLQSNIQQTISDLREESSPLDEAFLQNDSINNLNVGIESSFVSSISNILAASSNSNERKIPVAMAINEYIHAWLKVSETEAKVRIFGTVLISFPASILSLLLNSNSIIEPLKFKLSNFDGIKMVSPNKQFITEESVNSNNPHCYTLDKSSVIKWLEEKHLEKPDAQFFNTEVLRYELKDGVKPPLIMKSYWKTDRENTDLRIDYHLNTESGLRNPLLNVVFTTKVDCDVNNVIADPIAEWQSEEHKLSWKLTEISRHGEGAGSLKARLHLLNGPSQAAQSFIQFQMADTSISNLIVSVENDSAYNLSLLRRKVISGKYFCDPDLRS